MKMMRISGFGPARRGGVEAVLSPRSATNATLALGS